MRNIGEIPRNFSWIYKREERNDTISSKIGLFALRKICKGDDSLLCNVRELEQFLLDSKESVNDTNTTKKIVINPF